MILSTPGVFFSLYLYLNTLSLFSCQKVEKWRMMILLCSMMDLLLRFIVSRYNNL